MDWPRVASVGLPVCVKDYAVDVEIGVDRHFFRGRAVRSGGTELVGGAAAPRE